MRLYRNFWLHIFYDPWSDLPSPISHLTRCLFDSSRNFPLRVSVILPSGWFKRGSVSDVNASRRVSILMDPHQDMERKQKNQHNRSIHLIFNVYFKFKCITYFADAHDPDYYKIFTPIVSSVDFEWQWCFFLRFLGPLQPRATAASLFRGLIVTYWSTCIRFAFSPQYSEMGEAKVQQGLLGSQLFACVFSHRASKQQQPQQPQHLKHHRTKVVCWRYFSCARAFVPEGMRPRT